MVFSTEDAACVVAYLLECLAKETTRFWQELLNLATHQMIESGQCCVHHQDESHYIVDFDNITEAEYSELIRFVDNESCENQDDDANEIAEVEDLDDIEEQCGDQNEDDEDDGNEVVVPCTNESEDDDADEAASSSSDDTDDDQVEEQCGPQDEGEDSE